MRSQLRWYSFRWQVGVPVAVLAVLAWYSLAGRYQHPIDAGPAGPSVDPAHFSHVWSRDKHVLLGIGDSITAGFGATEGHGYLDLLVTNDVAVYPEMKGRDLSAVLPTLSLSTYAVSGSTSFEHLTDQVALIKPFPADVRGIVVITSGGNDLIHDYGRSPARDGAMYGCTIEQARTWRPSFEKRLRKLIEGVDHRFPGGCDIFVANIYDPTDGVGDIHNAHVMLPRWPDGEKALTLFNKTIADVCSSYPNVHLVDIHSQFLGHGIHCRNWRSPYYRRDDPHYWYYENLEDPNDRGYDAIRRIFLNEIAKVLDRDRDG